MSFFHFSSSESSVSWNIKNFFGVRLSRNIRAAFFWEKYKKFFQGFRFIKYKKFSRGGFILFFELGVKSEGFHLRKYKKSFPLRKYKNFFLILELKSSVSGNIRNFFRGWFVCFFGFGLGSAGFHFRKYKKRSILRKYKKSFPFVSFPET